MLRLYQVTSRVVCTVFEEVVADNFVNKVPYGIWFQWLRWCATNRKVAGSIPAGVIGIFH